MVTAFAQSWAAIDDRGGEGEELYRRRLAGEEAECGVRLEAVVNSRGGFEVSDEFIENADPVEPDRVGGLGEYSTEANCDRFAIAQGREI